MLGVFAILQIFLIGTTTLGLAGSVVYAIFVGVVFVVGFYLSVLRIP
jgi:hypothetical protein